MDEPSDQPFTTGREQAALDGALDALWVRFLPEMESRVAILEAAARAFQSNALSTPQQADAQSAAHKLAGVLGTFGLTRGTALARELETIYSLQSSRDPSQAGKLTRLASELRFIVGGRK